MGTPWVYVGPGVVCVGYTPGSGNVYVDGFGTSVGGIYFRPDPLCA